MPVEYFDTNEIEIVLAAVVVVVVGGGCEQHFAAMGIDDEKPVENKLLEFD